ncbi:MAG TPA: hypothetical protein VHZ73_09860 [Vicinamibacterales bacterium]|nr:hypothetical protein [Vicinamibacterales bacterium]
MITIDFDAGSLLVSASLRMAASGFVSGKYAAARHLTLEVADKIDPLARAKARAVDILVMQEDHPSPDGKSRDSGRSRCRSSR